MSSHKSFGRSSRDSTQSAVGITEILSDLARSKLWLTPTIPPIGTLGEMSNQISYSPRYHDDKYEFRSVELCSSFCFGFVSWGKLIVWILMSDRHITVPPAVAKLVPSDCPLLTEHEWRSLGIRQSRGWIHYGYFPPHRSVLLFRRPLPGVQQPWIEESAQNQSDEDGDPEELAAENPRAGDGPGRGSAVE